MNITNIDLTQTQVKEVEEMIIKSENNFGKRSDLILELSDGTKILFIKRDHQIHVQSIASLEF